MTIAEIKTAVPEISNQQADDIIFPPGNLWSEEPNLESYLHLQQILLLMKCIDWLWRDRNDYFAAGNLTIYFSQNKIRTEDFRGPDFFVVLNTEKKPRRSWSIWDEDGKYPNVIVELLSPSTAANDRGFKKQLYQDTFRTFDYFWFDPQTLEFAGFHLVDGKYQPLEATPEGCLWSQQLELFLGVYNSQLRFFTADSKLVATPEEIAIESQNLLTRYRERFGELPED
jgi:Uma2 family endonuclease